MYYNKALLFLDSTAHHGTNQKYIFRPLTYIIIIQVCIIFIFIYNMYIVYVSAIDHTNPRGVHDDRTRIIIYNIMYRSWRPAVYIICAVHK